MMMSKRSKETAALLLGDMSRSYTDMQVEMIAGMPDLFELYWELFIRFDGKVSARAAWVITHSVLKMPEIIQPYLHDFIRLAPAMKHNAEKRCLVKVLSMVAIPNDLVGEVIDRCFAWLDDSAESIAVRAYSIDTLIALSDNFPEIRVELCATLENHLDRFSRGLRNKGLKIIRKIQKEKFNSINTY